jgi:hypothetical protein
MIPASAKGFERLGESKAWVLLDPLLDRFHHREIFVRLLPVAIARPIDTQQLASRSEARLMGISGVVDLLALHGWP